ncbi:hypothetical protein PIB30_053768 [Stylosanthes scabra]|uniref:Uncharacterized protein n=1 Tax=Stylosanthes scabra TaxID=79078 RepID=A0ABU6UI05_9FABA|nr:hypothetical protein [Stylosanthes scabra]
MTYRKSGCYTYASKRGQLKCANDLSYRSPIGRMGRNGVKSATAICTPLPTRRDSPSSFNLKMLTADSRHACTAGEFIPVMRIYSSPSWDQYPHSCVCQGYVDKD